MSGRYAHVVVQELGREVGAVCPRKRAALGVHVESPEDFRVAERLEHVAAEFLLQIDLAGGAVAKTEPHGVAAPVAGIEEFGRAHDGNVGSAVQRRQGVTGPRPRGRCGELTHGRWSGHGAKTPALQVSANRRPFDDVLGCGPFPLRRGAFRFREPPERAHDRN